MKLTNEQKLVVETTGKNLLVSASAGAGKTHTMVERILHLIKEKKASLKQMLIVTFTKDAAQEMKGRVYKKLVEEIEFFENKTHLTKEEKEVSFHLKEQLNDISVCDISTLDTFCFKLVKQHFYEVSVDPASRVIEEDEALLLQNNSLNAILNEYVNKGDELFNALFEAYNKKRRDLEFKSEILKLYSFLKTKPDSFTFADEMVKLTYTDNLENNLSAIYLNKWMLEKVNHFKAVFKELLLKAEMLKADKLALVCQEVLNQLSLIKTKNNFKANLKSLNTLDSFAVLRGKFEGEKAVLKEQIQKEKKLLVAELKAIKEVFGSEISSVKNSLNKARPILQKMLEIIKRFEAEYQKAKKERAVLEFNDLEHYAHKILQNKAIRSSVKDRYEYVFIDEYQDTNMLQESILKLIARENNSFMVGDVKQSIYMFRECDPQIFVDKYEQYKHDNKSLKIDLNKNFRSSKMILDFANFIFSNIMTVSSASVNYKKDAMLEAGADYEDFKSEVGVSIINNEVFKAEEEVEIEGTYSVVKHLKALENSTDMLDKARLEARVVASKITNFLNSKIYEAKSKEYREVDFKDIAILTRSRGAYLKTFQKELEFLGIPINTKYKENIYSSYEAQLIISYLRLINNDKDDLAWFNVLSSHMCKLSYEEIANIRINYPKVKYFYEAVFEYAKNFNDITSAKINALIKELENFRHKTSYLLVFDLIEEIIAKYDLKNYFYSLEDGQERIAHLNLLLASTKKEEYKNNLFLFLNYIETFGEKENQVVEINGTTSSVTITTIHASKGLEYPIVILTNAGKDFTKKPGYSELVTNKDLGIGVKSYDFDNRIKKNTITRSAILLKNKEDELSEEIRLFYVALTRAKNHLWIVGGANLEKIKPIKSAYAIKSAKSYMEWVAGCLNGSQITKLKETSNLKVNFNDTKLSFEIVEAKDFKLVEDNAFKPIFGKPNEEEKKAFEKVFSYKYPYEASTKISVKNSVTEIMQKEESEEGHYSIKTFKVDELYNKKEDIDFSEIGTAYHSVMQYIDFKTNSIEEVKKELTRLKNNHLVTEKVFELIDADKILTAVKQVRGLMQNAKNIKKEQEFMMYVPYNEIFKGSKITDKILVQGVIDLVIEKDEEVIILDYKTSRIKKADLIKKYATQLNLYKLAYENACKKQVNNKVIYSFYLNSLANV